MAYYQKPDMWQSVYGEVYQCNSALYNRCTLFRDGNVGLAVIQQQFNARSKHTWWDCIDPWLANDIYLNPRYSRFFRDHAGVSDENGCYPTVTVRQIMRALGMSPLRKEFWETRF